LPIREILGNLGSEVFGILATIAFVDWVLELRRRQDRARALGWDVLQAIGNAVWVWQGGAIYASTGETLGIVSGISDEDPIESCTGGMLKDLGLRCEHLTKREVTALRSIEGMTEVLRDLGSLVPAVEGGPPAAPRRVRRILEESITALADVLNEPTEKSPASLIWHVDPHPKRQVERFRQTNLGGHVESDRVRTTMPRKQGLIRPSPADIRFLPDAGRSPGKTSPGFLSVPVTGR
jgi:hypothetical protein